MKHTQRGFALLIAVIFMSVMLSFGLALGSLSYKQQVLASSAIASQYAFYAADAGLECALYADQQQSTFAYTSDMSAAAPAMTCDAAAPVSASVLSHTASQWVIFTRLSLDSNKRCADVTVYKPAPGSGTTYLFSQGTMYPVRRWRTRAVRVLWRADSTPAIDTDIVAAYVRLKRG